MSGEWLTPLNKRRKTDKVREMSTLSQFNTPPVDSQEFDTSPTSTSRESASYKHLGWPWNIEGPKRQRNDPTITTSTSVAGPWPWGRDDLFASSRLARWADSNVGEDPSAGSPISGGGKGPDLLGDNPNVMETPSPKVAQRFDINFGRSSSLTIDLDEEDSQNLEATDVSSSLSFSQLPDTQLAKLLEEQHEFNEGNRMRRAHIDSIAWHQWERFIG